MVFGLGFTGLGRDFLNDVGPNGRVGIFLLTEDAA